MSNGIYDYTTEQLRKLAEQYPWWSGSRVELLRRELAQQSSLEDRGRVINKDHYTTLITLLHPTAIVPIKEIGVARLTLLTTDDLIDRFLKRDDYRIVAEEGSVDDLSRVEFDDDEDMVSEELAEIYLNQGLYDDAINTYRKLSLLNSEKSCAANANDATLAGTGSLGNAAAKSLAEINSAATASALGDKWEYNETDGLTLKFLATASTAPETTAPETTTPAAPETTAPSAPETSAPTTTPVKPSNPNTGDASAIILAAVCVTGLAAVMIVKKKER